MKKLLIAILCLATMSFSLGMVACGDGKDVDSSPKASSQDDDGEWTKNY